MKLYIKADEATTNYYVEVRSYNNSKFEKTYSIWVSGTMKNNLS